MGLPTTPQEAAPAYEDVIHNHPLSRFTPSTSSSSRGYASVPQDDDDIEENMPTHTHSASPVAAPVSLQQQQQQQQQPETFAQTIAGVFRKQPHVHCEACDALTERRERRANQKHCCSMVAAVFMALIVCAMILGIIVTVHVTRRKRIGHGRA